MGLKETFQKAAVAAFNAAGNVPSTIWYYENASTAYDVSTGLTSVVASAYMTSGMFASYKASQIDNEKVLPTDVRCLIPYQTFSALPIQHATVQRVEQSVSVIYEVMDYGLDPADGLLIFQLRKP